MSINLPVFEATTIIFFYFFFKWFFRFGIMVLVSKVVGQMKEKTVSSLKGLKGKGEGESE